MTCKGNSDTHCCWLHGKECVHLRENAVSGRRWACGLMLKYNEDWDKVLESPEYKADVAPILEPIGYTCKDWPQNYPGMKCRECGYGC